MNGPKDNADRGDLTTELALVFPVLPGKLDEVEHLASELTGTKASEFQDSQQNLGIRKESWFLNRSPRGDSVTVYIETVDVTRTLAQLIASRSPFDLWLKAEVQRVTGVEFGAASPLSLPKQILRFSA